MTPWTKSSYPIVGVVSTVRLAGPGYPGIAQIYWPVQEEPPAALTLVGNITCYLSPQNRCGRSSIIIIAMSEVKLHRELHLAGGSLEGRLGAGR